MTNSNPPSTPPEAPQGSNKADIVTEIMYTLAQDNPELFGSAYDKHMNSLVDKHVTGRIEHNATDSKPSTAQASLPTRTELFKIVSTCIQECHIDPKHFHRSKVNTVDKLEAIITKATARADAQLAFAVGWIERVCADNDLEFPEQLSLLVDPQQGGLATSEEAHGEA